MRVVPDDTMIDLVRRAETRGRAHWLLHTIAEDAPVSSDASSTLVPNLTRVMQETVAILEAVEQVADLFFLSVHYRQPYILAMHVHLLRRHKNSCRADLAAALVPLLWDRTAHVCPT